MAILDIWSAELRGLQFVQLEFQERWRIGIIRGANAEQRLFCI